MPNYLIQNLETGWFVTFSGPGSYTKSIRKAARWPSFDSAKRDMCVENERIVRLDTLLTPKQRG